MDKIKKFYDKYKKIAIPVAIILVLLIAVGIYFISQPNADTNKRVESQTEEKVDISKNDKQEDDKKDEDKDSEDKPADTSNTNADKPVDNTSVDTPSSSSTASNSNGNSNISVNKPASKPLHSHSWKDHTATKQVWVPNVVEVPVYETQIVYGAQFYTFSGYNELGQEEWIANGPIYWFENGFTHDDLSEIIFNALSQSPAQFYTFSGYNELGQEEWIANGPIYWFENGFTHDDLSEIIFNALSQSPDGVVDGVLYANYANIQRYDKVQTGTKQEDHGSYKTENYVDYQYCDCGATR